MEGGANVLEQNLSNTRLIEVYESQKKNSILVSKSSLEDRLLKLKRLKSEIEASVPALKKALQSDYKKGGSEVDLTEVMTSLMEVEFALKNLKKWMKPKKVSTPVALFGTSSQIRYEAKGVVLIIGPWNYPFSLVINPLISAVAAGNCAMIKPSELTPKTSRLISQIVSKVFRENEVMVFEGGAELSTQLLNLHFDHIFFTGSTRVGKIVMAAAAKNLTTATLELGGKSPTIIHESADIDSAAQKIVFGKFVNNGQTCVAPDYVFVPKNLKSEFVERTKAYVQKFYGQSEKERAENSDLCRIIDDKNYLRISKLVDESLSSGAQVETGNQRNPSDRYISPTIISLPDTKSPLMSEEIFGPVLPILTYESLDQIFAFQRTQEKPLALYVFSKDKGAIESVLRNIPSGGVTINNTLIHTVNPHLPFGGTGASGIGSYHGFFGFKAFSHERAILNQGPVNVHEFLYPPYLKKVQRLIGLTLKYFVR